MTVFHLLFALLSIVMIAYLLRHYNFVSTVLLHERKTKKTHKNIEHQQPTVSIIIPAHNEEKVIETLLQRITELYYPKEKFGGILLLNIYTVPILVGIGWLLAAICLLLITQLWTGQIT
jgi:cellulose synthase/poly-beta-1,6-N-acetylglucosamine synthase-like glycosyltransferase